MSLTTTYEPAIVIPQPELQNFQANVRGTPSLEILDLALDHVARNTSGTIGAAYRDCNGRTYPTFRSITTDDCPNGLGIEVDRTSGRLVFRYDRKEADDAAYRNLSGSLSQMYSVIALERALRGLGHRVTTAGELRVTTSNGKIGREIRLRAER